MLVKIVFPGVNSLHKTRDMLRNVRRTPVNNFVKGRREKVKKTSFG